MSHYGIWDNTPLHDPYDHITNKLKEIASLPKVPNVIIKELNNMELMFDSGIAVGECKKLNLRFMGLYPHLQSSSHYILQYNTKTKNSVIMEQFRQYAGYGPVIHGNPRNDKDIKHLSDDKWWNKIQAFNSKYKKWRTYVDKFLKIYDDKSSVGLVLDRYNSHRSHRNLNQFKISSIPKYIEKIISNYRHCLRYRFSELNNIRILEISESTYYVQYNTKTKKSMAIGDIESDNNIIFEKAYVNYKDDFFKKYLRLVSSDQWWYNINKFCYEEENLRHESKILCSGLELS